MLSRIKYILLVLAVSSTIIENIGGLPLYISVAYFVVSLIDTTSFSSFRFWKVRREIVLLWLFLFFYLFLVTGLFSAAEANFPITFIRWFKSILLFSLVLKDTFGKPQVLSYVLFFYITAAFVCAFLMMSGIGVELDPAEFGERRLKFLGTNVNKMAMVYVYSFTISLVKVDTLLQNLEKKIDSLLLIILLFNMALCIYVMAFMASRGAFVCVFIELLFYFLLFKKSYSSILNFLVVCIGLILVVLGFNYISSISIFADRMELVTEGDYGQRDVLVREAWNIFLKSPIFGVGLLEVMHIIGSHIGTDKTPHNIFLYVLSSGGLIGFSLLMTIIAKTIRVVFRYAYKKKMLLPILLLICILIDYAKNGAALTMGANYVFLAVLLNSCFQLNDTSINTTN